MFTNLIFWCEFPETVDWKRLDSILRELKMEIIIYVPCRNINEYRGWKSKIRKNSKKVKEINVWPALDRKDGYWFSGFTSRRNIDSLEQFRGHKMKIDLEPPIPKFNYTNTRILFYVLRFLFRKAKNGRYLQHKIKSLSKDSEVLVNEFPLPHFILKRWGIYYRPTPNVKKNIMLYTSVAGKLVKPLLRWYNFRFIGKAFRKDNDISGSIGLIGPGILRTERKYNSVEDFRKDISTLSGIGVKNVAVYSIDSIMKRKEPRNWLNVLRAYTQYQQSVQNHPR